MRRRRLKLIASSSFTISLGFVLSTLGKRVPIASVPKRCRKARAIDLDQSSFWFFVHRRGMTPSDELPPGKDEPSLKSSRLEDARRIVEEYAAELRVIIKNLHKRLN